MDPGWEVEMQWPSTHGRLERYLIHIYDGDREMSYIIEMMLTPVSATVTTEIRLLRRQECDRQHSFFSRDSNKSLSQPNHSTYQLVWYKKVDTQVYNHLFALKVEKVSPQRLYSTCTCDYYKNGSITGLQLGSIRISVVYNNSGWEIYLGVVYLSCIL